ncbi:MAG: tyrosine-type recombinase/integrase, partial [Thermoanaerobaculia bacterium]|nr:tyrosine-type recombinase/integrase [Thermoanaerobaculia bacterium]
MALKLTRKTVAGLTTNRPSGLRVFDTECRGFGVTVYPNGRKVAGFRYGGTQRRWITLGEINAEFTVEDARKKALVLRGAVTGGHDPAQERKEQASIPLFKEWVDTYIDRARSTKKSVRDDERYLSLCAAHWPGKRLDRVTPADIEKVRSAFRTKPTAANRLLASVSACFSSAIRFKLVKENPATGLPKYAEAPPRARVLSDDELARLVAAVEAEEDLAIRTCFRLLLETGCRLGEALSAKWEDFDLQGQRWRLPSPKAGTPQTIPLAPETALWLAQAPRVGAYVVPGEKGRRFDVKRPWQRLKDRAGLDGVTVHDIRRTFGKLVAKHAGIHMASALLRHSDLRVTAKVYAPFSEGEQREA